MRWCCTGAVLRTGHALVLFDCTNFEHVLYQYCRITLVLYKCSGTVPAAFYSTRTLLVLYWCCPDPVLELSSYKGGGTVRVLQWNDNGMNA